MPKFEIDIPHALPIDDAKKRLDGATGKIESSYGAKCQWTGDHELSVTRKGFDAKVQVEPARVHIDMNLGFLLVPIAPAIKAGLTKELTALLAS